MKRVSMIMVCLLAMLAASTGVKAQEVTITLIPGWTWISCPMTEAVDFATALGDFTPMTGDAIKSQWGNAYYKNGRWGGSISEFYPGYGYKYYSNRTTPVTVTFNAQQTSSQVVVTTSEPMLITAISAMGGGEVTTTDGTYILVKGLCWAAHENPTTNDDFYEEAESGVGTFSISMTGLNIATTYYVRAYAVTPNGTVYGDQKSFTTRDGIPTVATAEVTDIQGTYANGGGNITDDGGLAVTARGVCWSTSTSPTLANSHTSNGSGAGSFSSYMTGLTMSTTYYVRAYATNSFVTVYGNQLSFTTTNDEHVYVDLGLPSGLLWATCNVGADTPEDYGDYFAWGETAPKDYYDWSTYQYCSGSSTTITKYSSNSYYSTNGFTDDLTTLLPEDDAATANWGSGWRMPTEEEWQELYQNTTHTWTTQNGVNGRLFTAFNGNSLFLPAAGSRSCNSLNYAGSYGFYWSSSLYEEYPLDAWNFYLCSANCGMYLNGSRCYGQSVRAVRSPQTEHVYVDLGLPSGLLWATCNVGADTPEDYGDYFAWGETQPKNVYNWVSYQYCNSNYNTLTKYCNNSSYGYNGFTDDLTTLLPEDDAATANWGSGWRMPTKGEWQELYQNTTVTWTTQNGVNGRLFTASNGNSLFLPAAGGRWDGEPYDAGSSGHYWSSSLNTGHPVNAWILYFGSDYADVSYYNRCYGQSVRAVRSPQTEHVYVDLGLPSGLLWATCNVGADTPEDYGDYFAWGETQPKNVYNWVSYQYCNSNYNMTKYCNNSSYGYNGFTDDLTTLLPEDDAATANWGSGWRMPTKEEWQELYQNTTRTWTTQNGVYGRLFTASNGNSLFLPAAGCRNGSSLISAGSNGDYWSSSLYTGYPNDAWSLYFDSGSTYVHYGNRSNGFSVRPVLEN